jgi:uncharacterized membrane protein
MARRRQAWLLVPRQLRDLPADLATVLIVVGCTNAAVFLPIIRESPIRILVGLVFVLFVPGYAFVAALFPEAGEPPTSSMDAPADADPASEVEADPSVRDRGIDGIERVALSFGLSIAIVPLVGLVLNFTPFGIRLVPILFSLSLFTTTTTAIAAVRRWELPEDERFRVPHDEWIQAGKAELFDPESRTDAALNVALAIAVVLAVSSVAYAVAVPQQGERFSEFYILTEGDDGELVADGYPAEFTVGEPEPLHVGIGNNEHESVEYTIVVQVQEIQGEGNESRVVDRVEVDRWSTPVEHNGTRIQQRNITVSDELTGDELRLTLLLYTDDPPAQPTRENAYRDLHLWVTVAEQSGN